MEHCFRGATRRDLPHCQRAVAVGLVQHIAVEQLASLAPGERDELVDKLTDDVKVLREKLAKAQNAAQRTDEEHMGQLSSEERVEMLEQELLEARTTIAQSEAEHLGAMEVLKSEIQELEIELSHETAAKEADPLRSMRSSNEDAEALLAELSHARSSLEINEGTRFLPSIE